MEKVKPEELWFNTPDTATLCRGGGNGPNHPSQLYAIKKYVKPNMSFLDYGCGSATTWEAIKSNLDWRPYWYKGSDIIPKNIKWSKEQYPEVEWGVNHSIHKIGEPDESWDVVYSRHVVDHMNSFEKGMDEHCRVAKDLVVVVLWRPLGTGDEHEIKNITDQGKVYKDEYTNDYSRKKVLEYLKNKRGWKVAEVAEGVGKEVKGFDTVIVLKKS
jgi:ubiquinone/menaquinone biosynthesis C-methylase UbiE